MKGKKPGFADVGSQFKFLEAQPNGVGVTHLFRYEDQPRLQAFLSKRLDVTLNLARENVSPEMPLNLSPDIAERFRRKFAEEFDLIRRLGGKYSKLRTADQAEIALFWEDGPWGITTPGHFLYLAVQTLQHYPLSLVDLARCFALLGMTQCDSSICAWDNKFYHDILRPESAIRARAPFFNNPDPRIRKFAKWQSYIPTPEFPAYTSGHSTFGAAAAEIMLQFLGHDDVPLTGMSPDQVLWPQLNGKVRRWSGFQQAADENGLSRLCGGVHWTLDHKMGMKSGTDLARHAYLTVFPLMG